MPIDYGTRNIPIGSVVSITGHRSPENQGLWYPSQTVTLLEPCETYGWDVIDVQDESGETISVYSFSVQG